MRTLTKEAKAFALVTATAISLYNYMGKIPGLFCVILFENVTVRLKCDLVNRL